MLDEKYKGSILSFRNDRMGARLMTLMNTIRIAQDYDIPYFFAWRTDGRTSEELQNPTQIFDESYFNAHYVPIDDYRAAARDAGDLLLLPDDSTLEDLRNRLATGTPMLCQGSNLVVLPWEDAADVAPRYAAAITALQFNPDVTAAMQSVDTVLAQSGTAFHIRRGDIIYDPITSNQQWSNKYIPREFYEILAKRLILDPNARILVFSDEPEEIVRLKKLGPQILGAADVIPDTLTVAQRDFIELYAMSRCSAIYGPPGSGFSMTAGLMGNRTVEDVRSVLTDQEQHAALDLLVARLKDQPDLFLSDGDIGQSLPFAVDHLNGQKRFDDALDLLRGYDARGFHKVFFYRLLMRQNIIVRDHKAAAQVLTTLARADLDIAIPGRLEAHWGEMSRLAAISYAHAGDHEAAAEQMALAVSYAATNRATIMTLSQMCAGGTLDPDSFVIPFDPAATRPVPSQTTAMAVIREGHTALVPPGFDKPQWVLPIDLIAHDWSPFLGKSLGRGFTQVDMIKRNATLFDTQFARRMAPDVAASVRGLYAHALGDMTTAMACHDTALAAQPDHPLWLKRAALTRAAIDANDPMVIEMLVKAAEVSGPNSLYQAQLADYLWSNTDRPLALQIMRNLCDARIPLPELPFITARMMRQQKQSGAEALAYIDQALAFGPHVRRFMSMRAHVLFDMGDNKVDHIVARFGDAGDVPVLRARAT